MKMSEIKEMTRAELLAKGRDLRAELFNLKLQKASSQLEKPSRLTNLRHDVARIETQLSVLRKQEQSGS
ncbi:MAG: large subunit ribosomal protein L29 [Limisphaerales bacterium]|jgi:large subunit ribosomal protein L29